MLADNQREEPNFPFSVKMSKLRDKLNNMQLRLNIGFEQIFSLANQLSQSEKEKLISALSKSMSKSKDRKQERQLGKYQGKIKIAKDFNDSLSDFNDYM